MIKGTRVGGRYNTAIGDAIKECPPFGFERDFFSDFYIPQNSKLRVAMARNDAISTTAWQGCIRQMAGSSLQPFVIGSLEDDPLALQPIDR